MVEEGVATAFKGTLMTPIDREYIESLMKLGFKEDAKAKLDELYTSSRKQDGTLFTQEEKEYFEALVKGGQKQEAERALELAYRRQKDVDNSGLSPIDREYVEMLESIGQKDLAKEIKARTAKGNGEPNGARLLAGIDKEYVDNLMRLGNREKARKVVDSVYATRKEHEQNMMMDLLERARKK